MIEPGNESGFGTRPKAGAPTARTAMAVCVAVAAWAMVSMTGCTKPLLSPDEPRSQYDRYDQIRAQRSPSYLEDEYGRRRPNLYGRLTVKN